MNILDFKKWIIFCNEYSGFKKRIFALNEYYALLTKWTFVMNEYWIFWIFKKCIIFWTNVFILVCLRRKWLSPNVSNSFDIIQGSLVGPILVHFRGWIIYEILNNFPQFFWMNNSIECSGLYWMNIFLNENSGFCFELNHF